MRQRNRDIQASERNIVRFIFVEGVLKLGIPLTAAVQLIGYLIKYGLTTAHLGDCFTTMNLFLFSLTALFEGLLFAIMIGYCSDRTSVADTGNTLKMDPADERTYSAAV